MVVIDGLVKCVPQTPLCLFPWVETVSLKGDYGVSEPGCLEHRVIAMYGHLFDVSKRDVGNPVFCLGDSFVLSKHKILNRSIDIHQMSYCRVEELNLPDCLSGSPPF